MRHRFEQLARQYRSRAENDRRKLERITFYAQSALCRWKIVLEYFGEQTRWERCRRCDNCLREQAQAAQAARSAAAAREEPAATAGPAPSPTPKPGQRVRVPKYGRGVVEAVAGESVSVRFPNGQQREFLHSYVAVSAAAATRKSAPG